MENKEPKSGAPTAASINESAHTSGHQQPGAAPTWVSEKEKILNAINSLSISALGLSDRIMCECEYMTPTTAGRAMENIHDMALLQANVKTVIDFLLALLDNDVLEVLDKYNNGIEYKLERALEEQENTARLLSDAKVTIRKQQACYNNLWELTYPRMSDEMRERHKAYQQEINYFPLL